ncbi:hypothetical protein RvY_11468-1 [Ramazzottius varieornatus]|uniref:Uncharacterized protein n=1 Tax=Ramazzottius varieornatus TaxID=947166 RepID=A0A1D1VLL9_RAMVA|nr:hypothetical protein RvY_11468-1 [Ramazzottius varieornatus]
MGLLPTIFAILQVPLSFLISSSVSQQTDLQSECPVSWGRFEGNCYLFVSSPELTWREALSYCRAKLANLVTAETPEKNEYITSWLRLNDPTFSTWYTSGFDADWSGNWQWTALSGAEKRIGNDDPAWVHQSVNEQDLRYVIDPSLNMLPSSYGRALAYNFSTLTKAWTWLPVVPDRNRPFICELPLHMAADVPVTERTLDHGVVVSDPEEVPSAPSIIDEPIDAIFDTTDWTHNNWTSFHCVASGFPEPEYQWHRIQFVNGEEQEHLVDPLLDKRYTQTDGDLTIHAPNSAVDRGEFRCSASNPYGTVRSRRVSIRYAYVGDFALRREATQLVQFSGGAVPCDPPSFFPAVSYAWARDAFPNFVEENKRVFVSQDGNLYFSYVETSDASDAYQCIVKSAVAEIGKTGPFFPIAVRHQQSVGQLKIWSSFPKIFPPAPVVGDNVTIECVASGYPAPKYEWRRAGSEVPPSSRLLKHHRVLLIPSVQAADSDDYTCTASSVQGSVSATVTLDVGVAPRFIVPLRPQIVHPGQDVTWTCSAYGKPALSYRWLKNGKVLQPKDLSLEDVQRTQLDEKRLLIRDVRLSDSGVYQCEAENILGTALSSGELRVMTAVPSFRKYPLPRLNYASAGANLTMVCQPEGLPVAVKRWLFNDFAMVTSPRVRLLAGGDLFIAPVTAADQGWYTCEARNELGSDQSQGELRVLSGLRFREIATTDQALVAHPAVLRCSADTDAMLDVTYDWYLNDVPVDVGQNPRYRTGWNERRGYLFIEPVTFGEAGNYTCVARSPVDRIQTSSQLFVTGPPNPPSAPTVIPRVDNPYLVTLRWMDGAPNGMDSIRQRIEAITNHLPHWTVLADGIFPVRAISSFTVRREMDLDVTLQPWNSYKFRLSVGNTFGLSAPSSPSLSYDVPMAPPSRSPYGIIGTGGRTGELVITWVTVQPFEQNGPGIGYRVQYSKDLNTTGNHPEVTVSGERSRIVIRVDGSSVKQKVSYQVQVAAFNTAGQGPWSDIITVEPTDDGTT